MPHLSVYTVCVLIFLSIVQHELLSEFCYACSVCGYIRMCICMYICNLQKNRNTLMAGEVWWLFSTMAWHTSFPRSHCSIGIVWLVRMNPNLYIAYIHLWNAWWVLWCMLCGFMWVHACAFLISRQIENTHLANWLLLSVTGSNHSVQSCKYVHVHGSCK